MNEKTLGNEVPAKKTRKKRTQKTVNLDINDPKYRITFTPTYRDKQLLKRMINEGYAKNITDAICEAIRSYQFADLPPATEKEDEE